MSDDRFPIWWGWFVVIAVAAGLCVFVLTGIAVHLIFAYGLLP